MSMVSRARSKQAPRLRGVSYSEPLFRKFLRAAIILSLSMIGSEASGRIKTIEPLPLQAKCTQDTVGKSAFWWWISNYIDRYANQNTLQRVVGMPWRELGNWEKQKHHRT